MYGLGLLKGMGLTLKHFWDTYTDDFRWLSQNKYGTPEFAIRQGTDAMGIFTVEYPDEKIAVPERFRFVPFLVVNNYDDPYAPGDDWCTSCGICAKVCPPQCIWIVRGTDPDTGRPKPQPDAFYIDIDICMNCGYCAEYCPFDAIKMDHDYELASYDRTTHHIFDKPKLSKEFRYWQKLAPNRVWDEAQDRGHWEHRDVDKLAKKAGVTIPAPTEANMHRVTTVLIETAQPVQPVATAAAIAAPAAAAPAGFGGLDVAGLKALDDQAKAKTVKLTGDDRKAIAKAKAAVKDAGLDWDNLDLSAASKLGVAAEPVAVAAAPVVAAVGAHSSAPVPAAPAIGGNILAAKELDTKIKNKEIKPTGDDRKMIAQAKAAAKEAGLDWDNLDASAASAISAPAAPAPVAVAVGAHSSAPVPVAAPAPVVAAPAASGGNAELKAAKDLEVKGKNKEITLTGEDRKRIAAAKKAAKEAGIEWDSL